MNTNLILSHKHTTSAQHTHAHIPQHSVIQGFWKCITVLWHELLIRSKLWWAWWLTTVNTDIHALKHKWNHPTHTQTRSYVSREAERTLLTGVAGSAEGCWGRKLRKTAQKKTLTNQTCPPLEWSATAHARTLFTKMEEGVPLRAAPNQRSAHGPYGVSNLVDIDFIYRTIFIVCIMCVPDAIHASHMVT